MSNSVRRACDSVQPWSGQQVTVVVSACWPVALAETFDQQQHWHVHIQKQPWTAGNEAIVQLWSLLMILMMFQLCFEQRKLQFARRCRVEYPAYICIHVQLKHWLGPRFHGSWKWFRYIRAKTHTQIEDRGNLPAAPERGWSKAMPGPPQSHQWEMEICGVTTAFDTRLRGSGNVAGKVMKAMPAIVWDLRCKGIVKAMPWI